MKPIAIAEAVMREMYAHARATYPDECCGYLTGVRDEPGSADRMVACTNVQASGDNPVAPERGPDSGFVIAGKELFELARSFDGPRPARIIYHSHPNGRAYFSEVDRAVAAQAAYPVQHVVIGVTASGVTEVAQYGWSGEELVEVARWEPA